MKTKIAVSLPSALVEHVRAEVAAGRAASVSDVVGRALDRHVTAQSYDAFLDELLERTGGPLSDAERGEIDALLDG
jgi:Arc/MetJ-type ribon-helix-helix transcriptional regulator